MIKNAPNEKSRDFSLMFMNSMEDWRENPGSRPWTYKTWENPGSRPWTFDDYEYQLWRRRALLNFSSSNLHVCMRRAESAHLGGGGESNRNLRS
jgi:hypothetical protein